MPGEPETEVPIARREVVEIVSETEAYRPAAEATRSAEDRVGGVETRHGPAVQGEVPAWEAAAVVGGGGDST